MEKWVVFTIGIGGNIFLYLGIVWFFWKEAIKSKWYRLTSRGTYIKGVFFNPNKQITEYNTVYDSIKSVFLFNKGYYNVNRKFIYFTGRWGTIPTSYYILGNPNPMNFEEVKNLKINGIPQLDAEGFKEALEQKFIKDLMQEKRMELFLFLLVILNIIISIAIAVKQWGLLDSFKN